MKIARFLIKKTGQKEYLAPFYLPLQISNTTIENMMAAMPA